MKEPYEWEEDDILALISDGVQESLTLDYKRCASLDKRNPERKDELSKDVSAFANSAGGVIVYGVVEENNLPIKIDSGYDPKEISREWLEQVINSTIQRRIDNIRIKQIELKSTNPGRVIYVVVVPQSKRAPHMAQDHIFYKRFNYESKAMEEYEIRDIAQRMDSPDLKLLFYLVNGNEVLDFTENEEWSKPVEINLLIQNDSPIPAMYHIERLFMDNRIKIVESGGFKFLSKISLNINNLEIELNNYYQNYGVPYTLPIWQNVPFKVNDSHLKIALPRESQTIHYFLISSLDAPNMQRRIDGTILEVRETQGLKTIQLIKANLQGNNIWI